jgi:hypothetical protein
MSTVRKLLLVRSWERHSSVLFVGGLIYVFVGLTYLLEEPTAKQMDALIVVLRIAPVNVWAFVFMVTGFLTILSARFILFHQSWGYMLLCGLSAGWSAVYLIGLVVGPALLVVSLPLGLIWGLMCFLWWTISGFVNPESILEAIDERS